jgi:CBS domain-containing protein
MSANAARETHQEALMRVSEAMTRKVRLTKPRQHIQAAAKVMAEIDAGALPVAERDRLVGMITDRDIAVRAVAAGKGPDTPVREVMSWDVRYCFEDEDLDHVAHNMAEERIRRLPVVNRSKRLVGILSLADIAAAAGPDATGDAISGVSKPGGPHSQSHSAGPGPSDSAQQ